MRGADYLGSGPIQWVLTKMTVASAASRSGRHYRL